jgi:glycosyltransferase involved in cell wall biosynthesis
MTRAHKLVFFVTEDWYFCSHRLPLARAARTAGFDVAVVTRVQRHAAQIRGAGIELVPIDLARSGKNPLTELRTLWQLVGIYRRLKPDIAHHVALKPILYGTIAARIAGIRTVINAPAGLGYLFSSTDATARVSRPLVEMGFRALLKPHHVIVQNPDDRQLLAGRGLIDAARTTLIRGSGVDLAVFTSAAEPAGTPLVVLPARLLWDKGVGEFVAAARLLRQQGVQARFALVGAPDPANLAAVPQATLNAWRAEGMVELWGWRDDMAQVFRDCCVACLPSYREGLPKALLEAAACGRPLVSCDVPGCREIVRHGVNGLLVPPRDAAALAAALRQLIDNPAQRAAFGNRGRDIVTAEFSLDAVIGQTLALYRKLAPA